MQDIHIDTVTPDQLVSEILCGGFNMNRTNENSVSMNSDDDDNRSGMSKQDVVILDCQNPGN